MKNIKYIITILFLTNFFNSYSIPEGGALIGEFINPTFIGHFRQQYAVDVASYVNGGTTFTFPFTFNNPPEVIATVQFPFGFSPAITYVVNVSTISTTNVLVFVNKISYDGTNTVVQEAITGEVNVTIWAVDNVV